MRRSKRLMSNSSCTAFYLTFLLPVCTLMYIHHNLPLALHLLSQLSAGSEYTPMIMQLSAISRNNIATILIELAAFIIISWNSNFSKFYLCCNLNIFHAYLYTVSLSYLKAVVPALSLNAPAMSGSHSPDPVFLYANFILNYILISVLVHLIYCILLRTFYG